MAYNKKDLSDVCDRMWKADKNRLVPGIDYAIDPQGKTKSRSRSDQASKPLFTYVKPDVLTKPTYAALIKLLDNYESDTGVPETVTAKEKKENNDFIDVICETEPMKIARQYLASKGLAPSDSKSFKQKLYEIWFHLYSRDGSKDSSGFEHVFVGETRNKTRVIGFHNWIQFYLQEKAKNVDYKGFIQITNKRRGTDSQLLTIQFSWKRGVKSIGSSFIGTSPEFEMALYTVCFLAGGGTDVPLDIGGYDIIIKVYKHDGGKYIGACYPTEAA